MQLDRTAIVIRQRSGLELLDLSLLVLKRYIVPLAMAGSLLGIPLLAFDVWLIAWMVSEDALMVSESLFDADRSTGFRYITHLIALYSIQFPLVSIPTTLTVGALVFYEPVSFRQLLRLLGQVWVPTLLVLGILRLGLVPIVFEYFVDRSTTWHSATEGWILFVCLPLAAVFRAFWPFAPEIVGLERCPLRKGRENKLTYRKRSRYLHGPIQGEMFVRFLSSIFHGALLLAMLVGTSLFVQGVITGLWQPGRWIYFVALPVSLWFVGLFLTVFRFLSYIDSRIRLEGWELELRLRAEATRMLNDGPAEVVPDEILEGSVQS